MTELAQADGPEILEALKDFRGRVLEADKLRRSGDEEGAKKLEPGKGEIAEAISLWRKHLATSGKGKAKATTSAAKQKAAEISAMTDLNKLFE